MGAKKEVVLCNNILGQILSDFLSIQEGFDSFSKGYKGSNDEQRVEDMWLEGEESQPHVGEDEVLCQEI